MTKQFQPSIINFDFNIKSNPLNSFIIENTFIKNNITSNKLSHNISILEHICKTYIPNNYIKQKYYSNDISYIRKTISSGIYHEINSIIKQLSKKDYVINACDINIQLQQSFYYNFLLSGINESKNPKIYNYTKNFLSTLIQQLIYSNTYHKSIKQIRKQYKISNTDIFIFILSHLKPTTFTQLSQIYREINYGPFSFHKFIHRGYGTDYINTLQSFPSNYSFYQFCKTHKIQHFQYNSPSLMKNYKEECYTKYPPFLSHKKEAKLYHINNELTINKLSSLSSKQLNILYKIFSHFFTI